MDSDFLDAHERHWQDAELLFQNSRLANADHLYGMAAECGLKRLMLAFGMPCDRSGTPIHDKVHADNVWIRYESYNSGRPQYTLPPNPFANWNVNQRYAHQRHFDKNLVEPHRRGAAVVRKLLDEAQREGLL